MSCLNVMTPSEILECCEDDNGNAVDCFDRAVPQDNPYRTDLVRMLWATYRYRAINSLCVDRWLQSVTDRAYTLDRRYRALIEAYGKADITKIDSGYTDTYDLTTGTTHTGTDTTVSGTEDIPQTEDADTGTWLSSRNTTTRTPGVTDTVKQTGTMDHDVRDRPPGITVTELMDSLADPYARYADEFSDLFLDRWM